MPRCHRGGCGARLREGGWALCGKRVAPVGGRAGSTSLKHRSGFRRGMGTAALQLLKMAKPQGFHPSCEILPLYLSQPAAWARSCPSFIPPFLNFKRFNSCIRTPLFCSQLLAPKSTGSGFIHLQGNQQGNQPTSAHPHGSGPGISGTPKAQVGHPKSRA